MGKVKEMRLSIQSMLVLIFNNMGMNAPENIEEITDFVFQDVQKTIDPNNLNSGAVAMGFRRWIEAQAKPDENLIPEGRILQPKPVVIGYGDKINTVAELRRLMSDLDGKDMVCIQSIDLQSGDVEDLYPMNLDVIEGIELSDGSVVREVRFCQMMNQAPDTRDKQPVIDALITELVNDARHGDTTVLDVLLQQIPFETLLHSLPEKDWVKYKYQQKHDAVLIPVPDNDNCPRNRNNLG